MHERVQLAQLHFEALNVQIGTRQVRDLRMVQIIVVGRLVP